MLYIYNSLTRRKEPFEPLEPPKVRMYVCGMTVYDYCHLGHARVLVTFDVIARYLRSKGFDVSFVRNITDIDDKIIQRAHENQESVSSLTERFIAAMHEDTGALGVAAPDHEPRATGSMPAILAMIDALMKKGYAYQADNGDVYYDVSRFEGYGQLSGERPDELRAGARVEVGEAKDDPLDFVLWKAAKPDEPAWDAPWGQGRPGWHIECSAMSTSYLGECFDIHGGGRDLIFPHHENEIAQSEAATHCHPFVKYWMHNGFVRINEEKMSKSLGNFFTVRDLLQHYQGEELRYFILTSHYRSPLNYTPDQLDAARSALERLYLVLRDIPPAEPPTGDPHEQRFFEAMDDDFNTPEALAVLFELAHDANRRREQGDETAGACAGLLRRLGGVLGLLGADAETYLKGEAPAGLSEEEIERVMAERAEARHAKDFARADRLRDWLDEQGVVLEDRADGTVWRRK